MQVFRLVREKFAVPLTGKEADNKGARWNSIGVELIYTASNRSLAMAEVAAHFTLATLPNDFVMLTIHIPDHIEFKKLVDTDLPEDWKYFPHPVSTQKFGDEFVFENKFCNLIAPSVVTQGDYNILINPNHKDFESITIEDIQKFPFDNRIFK